FPLSRVMIGWLPRPAGSLRLGIIGVYISETVAQIVGRLYTPLVTQRTASFNLINGNLINGNLINGASAGRMALMLMSKKLKLGQPATKRLVTQHGAHLVCVLCHYDAGHCIASRQLN